MHHAAPVGETDRPRNVNDILAAFGNFLSYFGMSFFVAGAIFGDDIDVGLQLLLLRAKYMAFHV